MKKVFLLMALMSIVLACGSGGGTDSQGETGSIRLSAQWPQTNDTLLISAAPAGVFTVRVLVSGHDMAEMQADFDASRNRGTVQEVPAGSGRMITVHGLDELGKMTHNGSVADVTVVAGKTTDVGTVRLAIAAEGLWDRSRWNQALWGQ